MRSRWSAFCSLIVLGSLLVSACGGSGKKAAVAPSQTSATVAPTQASQPSPAAQPGLQPDGARILDYDKYLAETIGPRPAGTDKERQAGDFIAGKLRGFGYDVSFQEFEVSDQSGRGASLDEATPDVKTISSVPFENSGVGALHGTLLSAGLGAPPDFPDGMRGNIALIQRGDTTFNDKVANAEAAGARGAIIFNNEDGLFYGSLQSSTIPVVSISKIEGQALAAAAASGPVEINMSVAAAVTSTARNVIARPPGRDCQTVSGGHYDTVPQAPGASDNGSGTSAVLEIAGVLASKGEMGGNCFVLFSGEELGLLGSKFYVNSLDATAKQRLKAMFNYDMVGVGGDGWLLIGNANLQAKGKTVADTLNMPTAPGRLPANTGSDHASFISGGIPALFLYRTTDNLLHTPQDVINRVQPDLLEQAARFGVAMLESMNSV